MALALIWGRELHSMPAALTPGFPSDPHDTLVGDNGTMYELEVGLLWKHIWFPCMATEPVEIVTLNIGPETGLGSGTHDTEFFISDFDVLVSE